MKIEFVFVGLFTILLSGCSNNFEIYYINPSKLLQGYHGATAQHELFQAKAKIWQQRIDSLGTERQALDAEPAATQEAKEQRLVRYRDTIQQQAQQENQRMT